jgi:hypothetical protein
LHCLWNALSIFSKLNTEAKQSNTVSYHNSLILILSEALSD